MQKWKCLLPIWYLEERNGVSGFSRGKAKFRHSTDMEQKF